MQQQRLLYLEKLSNKSKGKTVVAEQIFDIKAKEAMETQRKVMMKAAMKYAVGTLLGQSDGRALQELLKGLDSTEFVSNFSSRDGQPLLKNTVAQASNPLLSKISPQNLQESKSVTIENIHPIYK